MKQSILIFAVCVVFASVWAGCTNSPTEADIPTQAQTKSIADDYRTYSTKNPALIQRAVERADFLTITIRDISTVKMVWYVTVQGDPLSMLCFESDLVTGMGFEIVGQP